MDTISWVARVDWESPDQLGQDLDAIDLIMEHLDGHSPTISQHPIDGVYAAFVSVKAPTLDAAVTAALDLVAGATAETPIGVEVLPEEIFDSRLTS